MTVKELLMLLMQADMDSPVKIITNDEAYDVESLIQVTDALCIFAEEEE